MDMPICLDRFLEPQKTAYPIALEEMRCGKKTSEWMWYIFPQLRGLGRSTLAWYYGIEDLEEAKAYLEHPVLGRRLREITRAVMELSDADPMQIFGWPDNLKFHSCMTLFAQTGKEELFKQALNRFYGGRADHGTMELLKGKYRGQE